MRFPKRSDLYSLWLPVTIYMAAIFYASSLSVVPEPVSSRFSDTFLHAVGYGGFALVTLRALAAGTWRGVNTRMAIAAWLIVVLYGVTDEWHQAYVPGRTAELRDLVNDAIGAFAAVSVALAWGIMTAPSRADTSPPAGLSHDL